MSVLDTPDSPSYELFHDWLLESYEETLVSYWEESGSFPKLTENPNRFDDLVPEIRVSGPAARERKPSASGDFKPVSLTRFSLPHPPI